MPDVNFQPYRLNTGEYFIDGVHGRNGNGFAGHVTDRNYFAVRGALNELQRQSPTLYRDITAAVTQDNPTEAIRNRSSAAWQQIERNHPQIHARLLSEDFDSITRHVLSGKPVQPMLNVNGRPFSPGVIEREIAYGHRRLVTVEFDAAAAREPVSLEAYRTNNIRITEPGRIEGQFTVNVERAATALSHSSVDVSEYKGTQTARIVPSGPPSLMTSHPIGDIADAGLQVMAKLERAAPEAYREALGSNLAGRAILEAQDKVRGQSPHPHVPKGQAGFAKPGVMAGVAGAVVASAVAAKQAHAKGASGEEIAR